MKRKLMVGVVLAAALALAGCNDDGSSDDGANPAASEQADSGQTGGDTGGETGGDTGGADPGEGGTTGGEEQGATGETGSGGTEGQATEYEGDWYIQSTDGTETGTLNFSGASVTFTIPAGTCTGSVSGDQVTLKCGEEERTGVASVSADGQTLTISWSVDNSADEFTREKPA